MSRPGLRPALLLILAGPCCLSGCLDTLVGLAVAPAAVGANAASQAGGAVGSRVPVDDQTVNDLDRILSANPNAENAAELGILRERLAKQPRRRPGSAAPSVADDAERRARWDRRVKVEGDTPPAWVPMQQGAGKGRSDRLTLEQANGGIVPVMQGVRQRPAPQAQDLPSRDRIGFAQPDWDAAVIITRP